MILDHRNIGPPGVYFLQDESGRNYFISWIELKNGQRLLAGCIPLEKFEEQNVLNAMIVRDFFTGVPKQSDESWKAHIHYELATANHKKNIETATARPLLLPRSNIVVLVGGGPSGREAAEEIEKHRDRYTVVTTSRSQQYIRGDYFVSMDPAVDNLSETDCTKTVGILHTASSLAVTEQPWREKYWHSLNFLSDKFPVFNQYENVACLAYEFVCMCLRPKKIILVGMEHPVLTRGQNNYYLHGVDLTCQIWFALTRKITTWNASPGSSVVYSCVCADFEEALNG